MAATKRALFERCPLCRRGVVEIAARQALTGRSFSINPCTVCGAVFSASGGDRFRLGYCDPRRLASLKGKGYPRSVCGDCIPIVECWVGKTLSKPEWDALAGGVVVEPWASLGGNEVDAEISPVRSPQSAVVDLGEDEVLHHETTVCLSEMITPGDLRDEAQLVLTNSRLVILHQAMVLDIRLADIEKVEPSFPGFVIRARSIGYPLYCFPSPGDPVYHAIITAMKRIH